MKSEKHKKARRLAQTANAIKKQMRIAKNSVWHISNLIKQPHRMAKRHAMDCGNSKCLVCHSEKIFDKPTLQKRKFIEAHKDEEL